MIRFKEGTCDPKSYYWGLLFHTPREEKGEGIHNPLSGIAWTEGNLSRQRRLELNRGGENSNLRKRWGPRLISLLEVKVIVRDAQYSLQVCQRKKRLRDGSIFERGATKI